MGWMGVGRPERVKDLISLRVCGISRREMPNTVVARADTYGETKGENSPINSRGHGLGRRRLAKEQDGRAKRTRQDKTHTEKNAGMWVQAKAEEREKTMHVV